MMNLLIVWFLLGFIPFFILAAVDKEPVLVKDLFWACLMGILGPILPGAYLITILDTKLKIKSQVAAFLNKRLF